MDEFILVDPNMASPEELAAGQRMLEAEYRLHLWNSWCAELGEGTVLAFLAQAGGPGRTVEETAARFQALKVLVERARAAKLN